MYSVPIKKQCESVKQTNGGSFTSLGPTWLSNHVSTDLAVLWHYLKIQLNKEAQYPYSQ